MSEPTFRPDRLVAAGEANDASGQRNGSTLLHKNRCERCGLRAWDDLYSPDGLGGHEILICSSCRREFSDMVDGPLGHRESSE